MPDWGDYQKCDVCGALLGEPCSKLSGYVVNSGSGAGVFVMADAPHTGRKLRAEAARKGGDRG